MAFSTYDNDNDGLNDQNCAQLLSGGFWFEACYHVHLNGIYGGDIGAGTALSMDGLPTGPARQPLRALTMKIRPV